MPLLAPSTTLHAFTLFYYPYLLPSLSTTLTWHMYYMHAFCNQHHLLEYVLHALSALGTCTPGTLTLYYHHLAHVSPSRDPYYMTNGFRNNPKDVESHCESKK